MASGYGVSAWTYPLWFVLEEAETIVRRTEGDIASEALMFQMALATIPSMAVKASSTKEAGRNFNKQIQKMLGV